MRDLRKHLGEGFRKLAEEKADFRRGLPPEPGGRGPSVGSNVSVALPYHHHGGLNRLRPRYRARSSLSGIYRTPAAPPGIFYLSYARSKQN